MWRPAIQNLHILCMADNSTVESCSLSISVSFEAKELKTCRSLVKANYANEDIKQIKTFRNTYTYLFYSKVNCASKPSVRKIVVKFTHGK